MLPAVAMAAWLAGPDLSSATSSWDRPGPMVAVIVALAVGFGATGGATAALPLGPLGTAWSLVAVTVGVGLAVPDTEGVVLLGPALVTVAAALTAAERRHPGGWPVPDGAAALACAAVVLVGLSGATAGVAAALGATGCVTVLLGAAPLVRRARADQRRPALPAWASAPVVLVAAVAVARLGAVRSTTPRALAVALLGGACTAVALELAARFTSGRAHPPP